jgi:hypothetical protein
MKICTRVKKVSTLVIHKKLHSRPIKYVSPIVFNVILEHQTIIDSVTNMTEYELFSIGCGIFFKLTCERHYKKIKI